MATVWGGIGNLFCNRFNQAPEGTNGQINNDLERFKSLYKTGLDVFDNKCDITPLLADILTSMKGNCTFENSAIANIPNDQYALQNSFLTKTSLLVLSKSLFSKYPAACPNISDYDKTYNDLKNWLQNVNGNISWSNSPSTEVSNANYNQRAVTETPTYLNSYIEEFAYLSKTTDSLFYSTTMKAISAYAPIIRESEKIKFLQNVDETMARATYELLQSRQGEFTFLYDDQDKLFLLIRMIKNIYFTTRYLPTGWRQDLVGDLVSRFQSNGNPHTYVLLFNQETADNYTREFLQLALMHQQLRKGIKVILISSQDGCAPYRQYINSGASLVTFATSKSYAPTIPDHFYNYTWTTSALYLDGLTYITQKGTNMPSEYILSRIDFTEKEPTVSPVESMAILDCAVFTEQGVGSYVKGRNPVLTVTSVNSTIYGRTIRVGIVNYPPFYNNGSGFSTAVLSRLATTAGIHSAITFYNVIPDKPYYAAMEEAIIKNEIDAGITPMPLTAVKNGKVIASQASLTTSYTLLRQLQRRPADYLLILRPLAMPVWLGSCFLAFIFAGLLMLFGHLKPVIMRNLAEGEMTTKTDLFGVSSLGVASSFTLTKLQIIPTTLSSRLFALTMWLFSYLLLVLYASAMMTILLRVQKPINNDITVDDVLHPSKCDSIIVLKDGIGYDQIITSLSNSQRAFSTVDNIQTAYNELMKSKKTVLLASSIEASYISSMDCGLEQILYTEIYDSLLVFPYNSGWEFGSAFNDYLAIIDGAGVFSKAAAVYFETGPCYHPPYKNPLPVALELNDTASIYIFLLIGIIVSFIFLGFELIRKHRKEDKVSKEQGDLVPGSRYPAVITSMKRNGIYVKVADRPDTVFIPNSQLYSSPLKVYNAIDLGLSEGESIEVIYFGKGSDQVTELFCRYYPERKDDGTH
nr:glutamate receptor ionotropic kainate 1 [Hymenolepis microstoma]